MAKLYQHKGKGWDIHYHLWFPDGTDRRKWRTFGTKALAQASMQDIEALEHRSLKNTLSRDDLLYFLRCRYLSKEEAALLMGRAVVVPTLSELAQEFLAQSAIECRPHTHATNKGRINNLLEYFGEDLPATEVTRNRIEQYRSERIKSISASTINKELIKLAQLLDLTMERGAITENPARMIRRLKDMRERKPRALIRSEIICLRWSARKEKKLLGGMAYPIIMIYLYTGMRREELVWLEWEDVNLEKRKITIQAKMERGGFITKTGKARMVGIATKMVPILARLPRTGRYIFGGALPLMRGDGIGHAFKKLVKKANLPPTITLHSLRHTYITHLMEAGVNPRRVQELAGHATFSSTWRYSHTLPSAGIEEDRLDF
jgi:site-specific recombinase XerD